MPTGWDVTVDLARRLALLEGDDAPDDPIAWYVERHGAAADYSAILDGLARTPADRRNLLQPYFEPTEEEREQGLKAPTAAHRSIAALVAAGYVRVIVTTNFDRLLEAALADAGVQPVVIESSDAASGATPVVHSRCTIIKVHGDYLSPNIRNTVEELERYDEPIDRLLDQVFDQYGLVVCGWSGVWDTALRNALLRCPTRRYAAYWARVGELDSLAVDLATHRGATVIEIDDADSFFSSLAAKVQALAQRGDRDPLSTELAVAELKRYLPDPVHRIRLRDLVMREVERVVADAERFGVEETLSYEDYLGRVNEYAIVSARMSVLLANMAFYASDAAHDALLVAAVERLFDRPFERSGKVVLLHAQRIPNVLAMYAIGLGALLAQRVEPLLKVWRLEVIDDGKPSHAVVAGAAWRAFDGDALKRTEAFQRRKTPTSDWLHSTLRDLLRDLVPSEDRFDGVFDDLEYLWGLTCTDVYGHGLVGRFAWRRQYPERGAMDGAVGRYKDQLFENGFFNGSDERLAEVKGEYEQSARGIGWM